MLNLQKTEAGRAACCQPPKQTLGKWGCQPRNQVKDPGGKEWHEKKDSKGIQMPGPERKLLSSTRQNLQLGPEDETESPESL